MNKLIIFFLIFYIAGWLFFSFRITEVPPGINGDEAAIGYNAALVARSGRDSSGRFLPLFVSAFNLTDWKQPITFYSTVLVFKLFGPSYALLRQVSITFILVSATLIFLLTREFLGLRAAFISLVIFITTPAVLIQSHLALENIAPIPFTILWLMMLSKYQKNLKSKYLFLSAIFLGISLFTYPGMRLIFPIFSLLTLTLIFYLNRNKKIKKVISEILKFLLTVSIFPIFMYSVKNQYPGAVLAYNRPHIPTAYQELIMPYISSFDPSFLFITGDTTPYHSTGKQGVFLLATLPLFILGIIRIIRKKDLTLNFILFAFFLSPLLYGLVGTIHRGSRLLVLLPLYALIAANGVLTLTNIRNKVSKFILITFLSLLVLLNYADFLRDYWYEYPQRVKSEFAKPYHIVFEKARRITRSSNLTPYIQEGFRGQNQIALDFFEQIYFPGKLRLWKVDQPIPQQSIIIVSNNVLSKRNIDFEKIDDFGFGLIINQSKNEIK